MTSTATAAPDTATSAAQAASAPASLVNEQVASEHLVNRLANRKEQLIASLSGSDFYIEMAAVIVAIVLARIIGGAIQKYVAGRLAKVPPKYVDSFFITTPLKLLTPLLALMLITMAAPLLISFDIGSGWVEGMAQMCLAYIYARAVVLAVRSKPVAYFIAAAILVMAATKAMRFTRSMDAFLEAVSFDVGKYHISLLNSMHGLVIFVVVFWVAGVMSNTLESYLRRSSTLSYTARELTVRVFRILLYFIAFVITLSAVGIDITAFAVFGGALGVGIGLGLQKLTGNFVSSVQLLMEKSVKIGDMVEVSGYTGIVRQLNMRYALIETTDGREIMIPNEVMVSSNLINWTHTTPKASIEIKVTIDYDSDPQLAHQLMLEAVNHSKVCIHDPAPSCFLREFSTTGIAFNLTFWIADITKGRNGPQSEVMFAIIEKFRAAGIQMAKAA